MITDLSLQPISQSFQNLMQISGSNELFDGLGNQITTISNISVSNAISSSYSVTSSFASRTVSSSFATTSSFAISSSYSRSGSYSVSSSLSNNSTAFSGSLITEFPKLSTPNIFTDQQTILSSLDVQSDIKTQSKFNIDGIVKSGAVKIENIAADTRILRIDVNDDPHSYIKVDYVLYNNTDITIMRNGNLYLISNALSGGVDVNLRESSNASFGDSSDITFEGTNGTVANSIELYISGTPVAALDWTIIFKYTLM